MVITYWTICFPTGDAAMPWTSMGPFFPTLSQAREALAGWRPELRREAAIRPYFHLLPAA